MNRTLTDAEKATLRTLAKAYTKACNSGTGPQAERAEKKLGAFMDGLGK